MFRNFIPDCIVSSVYEITPQLLNHLGKKAVIFDIDNTLTSDRNAQPDEKLKDYLNSLRQAGIQIALVSNNNWERVECFNRSLGCFATAKAGKPKRSALQPGLKHFCLPADEVLFAGDQILTDILAAKRNGLCAYLVEPINPYENPFFFLKRLLEKPFLFYYRHKHKKPNP